MAALGCMAALGATGPARAEPAGSGSSDSGAGYRVPPECPERQAWHAALSVRLLDAAAAARLAQRLTLEIRRSEQDAGEYVGAIDGRPGAAREVRGATCEEVLEALSLITAIGAEPASTPPPEPDRAPAASAWELSPAEMRRLLEQDDASAPAPAAVAGVGLGVTTFALLETTASPRLGLNYGIGASLRWRTETLEPWLFVGIYRGVGEQVAVPDSGALTRFTRWSTYVVGCPLRWALHDAVALRPCLDLDLGQLTGEGLEVGSARRRRALLASTGLELRLEWSPWPALQLSAMFGGVVPLARPRFYLRPQLTTFEVAPVGLRAGGLASLLF